MATLLVSSSGDNSDGLTWATAFNTINTAFDNLTGAQDDTVILDDEDHNQTTNLYTSGGTKTGGTIILESRSGSPQICSISGNPVSGSGNYYLLRNNETATGNPNLKVRNITFKDHFRADSLPLIFNSNTSDFTLENCVCHNLTLVATSLATNGLIRQDGTTSKEMTIAGLTVTDCTVDHSLSFAGNEGAIFSSADFGASQGLFSDIVVDNFTYNSGLLYQMNGLFFYRGPQTWSGVNSFKDINIDLKHDSYGIIKMESLAGYSHSIIGSMLIDNVDVTITTSNNYYGAINVSTNDTLTINASLEAKNIFHSLGGTDYGIISNIHSTATLIVGGNISVHDNISNVAAGFITNRGGDFTLYNAEIYNNSAFNGGALGLLPQSATQLIYNCSIHDNISFFAGAISSVPASGTNSLAMHNCTFFNNQAVIGGFGDGMLIGSSGTTDIYNIDNCIFWNQDNDDEIRVNSGGENIDLNISNTDVRGGQAAVIGEDTYVNNIESDPQFNDDLTLSRYSSCVGIGLKWWPRSMSNPQDINGNYFWDAYVDIGAFSTWDGSYRRVPSPGRLPVD